MKTLAPFTLLLTSLFFCCALALADQNEFSISPKAGWLDISDLPQEEQSEEDSNILVDILLYVPNRFLDLLDIVKIDLGVGPAAGAIVRVSEHAQVGARVMLPASLRVGLLGRRLPIMLESNGEFALGSSDTDRNVCSAEIGVGADALLVGAYLGLCPDELIDFVTGIFFLDIKNDDLK